MYCIYTCTNKNLKCRGSLTLPERVWPQEQVPVNDSTCTCILTGSFKEAAAWPVSDVLSPYGSNEVVLSRDSNQVTTAPLNNGGH